ncbi:MAG: hypothetical protein KDB10_01640 [Acidimicrobiales bacterium]|nr:hypothetical protein [Acidimicrobiales bacterium]MCB9373445.1 hypothetical protein [Microthrixaceae bacterium]
MGTRPLPVAARRRRRRWRAAAGAAALVAVAATGPSVLPAAVGDVGGDHLTTSGVQVGDSLDFYAYGDATPVSAPADTPWGAGTLAATRDDLAAGALTLDHFGTAPADPAEPWWDDAWRSRRCFDVDHTAAGATAETEYQVRVVLDTQTPMAAGELDAGAADLRAARYDGGGFVDLDLYVEPEGLASLATGVWVQLDDLPAGATTDFCLYWNHEGPVASVSDPAAVFSYASPRTLYYTVSDGYGPGADRVDVAAYLAGTDISHDGSPAVTAGAGGVVTFTGNTPDSSYATTGPLAGVGTDDGQDGLVPAAFAGTAFVVPTDRDGQTFSVRAPWASADIEVLDGSSAVAAATVTPGDGTVTLVADVTAPHTAVVRSTNGVPFLLTHRSDTGGDAVVGVPAGTDDLLGVQSRTARLGYGAAGADADVQRSDGTEELVSGDPDGVDVLGPSAPDGAGPAVRVTGIDTPTGALQQDDGDGDESTAFWPRHELGDRYLVPVDAEHVVVACPVAGTEITVGGSAPVPCAGTDFGGAFIGHARDASGWTVGSTAVTVASASGEPFWLSFDRASGTGTGDEVQVGSWRQARTVTFPAPAVTVRPEEGRYRPVGLWDSAPIDTGVDGVFGRLRWEADTPAGTAVAFQLASGDSQLASVLAPFVGPDGTSGTSYTTSDLPVGYGHDFDRWVRIRALLTTTDPAVTPTVDSVTVDTALGTLGSALDVPTTVAVASPAGVPTSTWVARVHTVAPTFAGSTATLRSAGAPVVPGVDAATVAFARPDSDQVVVAGESVFQPTGPPLAFSAAEPHSIRVDSDVSGPATLDVTWTVLVGGGSPVIEHRFRFALSG